MRRIFVFIIASILMAIGQLLPQQKVDGIAAVVGNEIILESELHTIMRQYSVQKNVNIFNDPVLYGRLSRQFLQQMIDNKLLLIKAEEDTITADDERVDQLLEQQLNNLIQQAGSEESLVEYYGSPLPQIKKDFRKQIEQQLKVEQLRQMRFSNIKISRREVEQFYQQYQDSLPQVEPTVDISHILLQVKPSEENTRKAYNKILEVKRKLEEGEDFATLAKKYSDDPSAAKNEGDLGWVSRGDLVKAFEEVAFSLEENEISDIVQTQFGFHIIQLLGRKEDKIHVRHILSRLQPSEEDEQRIVERLREIRQKISEGEATFEEMALQNSDDPNVEEDKGRLGEFALGSFQVKAFGEAAKSLEPGEISQPFKTDFGYHIIKLNDRQEGRTLSLQNDWQRIEQMAIEYKRSQKFQDWIAELRKEIPVDIKMDI